MFKLNWIPDFAKMAIEVAKQSTPEDDKPRPKVGAVAVEHGQLLGTARRTAVEDKGKKADGIQNFVSLRL